MAKTNLLSLVESTPVYVPEEPQEVVSAVGSDSLFPLEACGRVLAGVIRAIQDKTQAPMAICAQSVLAASTVVAQAYVNIELPTGVCKPCSLFMLTVGESGERKSSCDHLAMAPIKAFEESLREQFSVDLAQWFNRKDAWEKQRSDILRNSELNTPDAKAAELNALGPMPARPLEPIVTCEEPTYAALCKTLETGRPAIGIFSDEGGEFIGGHAMKEDNRLQTISGLSKAWDGQALKRVRAGDGNTHLHGKRLSMHLMTQPEVAGSFLSDRLLVGQGLLSRFLVAYPSSNMGNRYWREPLAESDRALQYYYSYLLAIMHTPSVLKEGTTNELAPRTVAMTPQARKLWIEFYNSVESELGELGELRVLSGFANKLCENIARLATVIAFIDNPQLTELSGEEMARGIGLGQFYLREALRILANGKTDPALQDAERLQNWLQTKWTEPHISISEVSQLGPSALRNDKARIRKAIQVLEEAGWLSACDEPVRIKEKQRKEAWSIHRKGERNDE